LLIEARLQLGRTAHGLLAPMHPLAERVRRTIRRHALLPPGSRVVVALSGGADSVALTHLLREISPLAGFHLVGLAHLNHQLRGTAADADEELCRRLAAELSVAIEVERLDVGALARERRGSIEETAREVRYRFLERAASRLDADRIAVGHTIEDQAETFLLRLLRGAGPRGLAGIYPRFGQIVRPLLEVSHADLRRYLGARGIDFQEDETNRDTTIPRNRVRHELIPFLQERFSPRIVEVLAREATLARDDAAWLERVSADAAAKIVRHTIDRIEIDIDPLLEAPPSIARRILLKALQRQAGRRFVGFDHVDALLALATGNDGPAALDLPGQRARREGGTLILSPRTGRRGAPGAGRANSFQYLLSIPGEVVLAEAGCAISAEGAPLPPGQSEPDWLEHVKAGTAVVDAAALSGVLGVRSRKPGDRFRPLGLSGRKKLQDLFVDLKIPRASRDVTPLVVDDRDRIIWVAGHAIADDFRVTSQTKSVVILKLRELGATE
jgi:tRNA(Ile)-lysidine synthase